MIESLDQNESMNFDTWIKLIIVGDSSVGKTSLLHWYTKNEFNP